MDEKAAYRFEPKKFFLWLPIYFVIAFALYVLSTGPMYWAIYEAYYLEQNSPLALFYYPLVLMSQWGPFGQWMDWYIGLWVL